MKDKQGLVVRFSGDVATVVADDGLVWFDALPAQEWHTKAYGAVEVTPEKLENLVTNFKNDVRGIEIATDYEHGLDPSKGTKASGWIKDVAIKDVNGKPTLALGVNFTGPAKQEIKDGEWRYFSVEWEDDYVDSRTGAKHKDVLTGGALTNKPVVKGVVPINFSEFADDPAAVEFADLSAATRNALPDSAFMYVNGKNKGDRHFPFKHADGTIDIEHVRKIIQLAPRASLPQSVIDKVVARAHKLLENYHSKKASEGGEMNEELLKLLGLSNDADDAAVIAAVTKFSEDKTALEAANKQLSEEVEPLKKLKEDIDGKKQFADMFPAEHKRMADLEAKNRAMEARSFSEGYRTVRFSDIVVTDEVDDDGKKKTVAKQTTKGLSGLALQKIEDTSLKFADGTAELSDFKDTLDAVVSGIVDYGTTGNDVGREPSDSEGVQPIGNILQIRTKFSDLVIEAMDGDKLSQDAAIKLVAEKNPELWEAYKNPVPVR